MPTTIIDTSKSAQKILMDEINIKNNTTLDFNDFIFSIPETVTLPGQDVNTKIRLTPKENTTFYGFKDIFYKRLDLNIILARPVGTILPGAATLLSEIIPAINIEFGIGLKTEDYIDQPLQPYNASSIVGQNFVNINAKAESLLFFGSTRFTLGPLVLNNNNNNNNFIYYLHSTGQNTILNPPSPIEGKKQLISINSDGTNNNDFVLLRNTNILRSDIDIRKVILRNDGSLVLLGIFNINLFSSFFESSQFNNSNILINNDNTSNIICNSIVIYSSGEFLQSFSNTLFYSNGFSNNPISTEMKLIENVNIYHKYFIDKGDGETPGVGLVRYSQDGVLDTSYSPNINYIPINAYLCDDGSLYLVKPETIEPIASNNNIPGKVIIIEKLYNNGFINETFQKVIISGDGINNVLPVAQLYPIFNDGFWILFNPLYGVSTSSISPIINGVPLVPVNNLTECSWNPIVKISENGNYQNSFNSILKNNLNYSIYSPPGPISMIGNNLGATLFTYKNNPITGFLHSQPMNFNQFGDNQLLTELNYSEQYKWISSSKPLLEPINSFISYGLLDNKLTGINDYCVGRYNFNGTIDKVIFRQPSKIINETEIILNLTLNEVLIYIEPPIIPPQACGF